jgi:hypothetical protein
MAGTYRSGNQLNSLLRELLALFDALEGSERHVQSAFLVFLFSVYLRPLGLMAS